MSDEILEEPELENQPTFAHYIQATGEIVEEFRDVLVEHTVKLQQEATARGGNTGPDHIREAAALHRLRIGCDNFLNVLMGNY
jgi:hypothetical protein